MSARPTQVRVASTPGSVLSHEHADLWGIAAFVVVVLVVQGALTPWTLIPAAFAACIWMSS